MKRLFTICIFFTFAITSLLPSQVTVVKQAEYANPKLFFSGISGDQQFANYVLGALKSCDWFDVITAGNAKYNLSGSVSSGRATITVTGEKSFSVAVNIDSSNPKWTAYKLVDAVLNRIFDIPGICASKIVFVAKNRNAKNIFIADFDGSSVKQITVYNTLCLEPEWGMNNSKIVYTLYQKNYTDIVAYDMNSKSSSRLANYPGLNNGGVISPNGQYLAMILSKDKKVALYVRNINGGASKRITKSEGVDGCPAWSPDSKRICFVSNMIAERPSLYISDFSTNKIYPVRCLGSEAVNPSWSPDGSKIVYSAKIGNYILAVYDVNTGESIMVELNADGDWFSPSWAPDSRHVICSRRLDYFYQLYMVDTFTGKAIKICPSKMNLSSPAWSALYK